MTEERARVDPGAERPVVACYCATFLKPEMRHIYRQITALRRWRPLVITQKREEREQFPLDSVTVVGKPATHFLRRFWFRQLRSVPWQISRREEKSLAHTLEHEKASLLHIYFGHIAVHLLPLIRSWPHPVVVSFHGADVMVDMEKPAYREATANMLEAVELVLVRSESLGRAVAQLGCRAEKIRVQRTGIPMNEMPFLARVCPTDGAWHFVQACRLIEKKGLATSLRAFADFTRHYPHSRFVIAGEGPLRAGLEQIVRELGVAEKVIFRGFISQRELRDLFYASHIFLHPSETSADGNQEGVPNSMLEAMASGLPVFATAHGGIPEAIEDGVSGILVPESDHAALARALLSAVEQPIVLARLAERGAAVISEKFEQATQVRKLEDFYFEALQGTRRF